ncbi:MAG TPA: RNA polymerase sigma factor [Candidatus Sulfotelmatobacter sp.]|nr:RNA polymerase sigma factor [Candidatus Sulfotelmatobacter sp.]
MGSLAAVEDATELCGTQAPAFDQDLQSVNLATGDQSLAEQAQSTSSFMPDEKIDEAEIIRRAHNGDSDAFELIFRKHNRRLYGLCLRMVGNAAEAEDLTQETFLLVFRRIDTFRHESAFSTWLHRVAVNVVLMHLRKKSPPMLPIEPISESDEDAVRLSIDVGITDPLLAGSIDRVTLTKCIKQLPVGYKAVFTLHDIEGYDHRQIGKMLGRSEGNSKSQLHKARMRLRELLHEDKREKARMDRLSARKSRSQITLAA